LTNGLFGYRSSDGWSWQEVDIDTIHLMTRMAWVEGEVDSLNKMDSMLTLMKSLNHRRSSIESYLTDDKHKPIEDHTSHINAFGLASLVACSIHRHHHITKRCKPMAICGGMTPGIHRTRHGLHHQRWPSPQDQGVRRMALVGVHRKVIRRYCNTK
jgi:hypothetical protein